MRCLSLKKGFQGGEFCALSCKAVCKACAAFLVFGSVMAVLSIVISMTEVKLKNKSHNLSSLYHVGDQEWREQSYKIFLVQQLGFLLTNTVNVFSKTNTKKMYFFFLTTPFQIFINGIFCVNLKNSVFHSSPRRRVLDKHCLRALSARRSLLSEGLRMRAPSQPPVQPPGAPLHTRRALVKQKRPFFSTPSCLYTNGFSAWNALSFLTPYLSAQFFFISSLKIKKKKI